MTLFRILVEILVLICLVGLTGAAVVTQTPTAQPTPQPTSQPTSQPSGQPSCLPSGQPTGQPSGQPTSIPTSYPSTAPILAVEDEITFENFYENMNNVPVMQDNSTMINSTLVIQANGNIYIKTKTNSRGIASQMPGGGASLGHFRYIFDWSYNGLSYYGATECIQIGANVKDILPAIYETEMWVAQNETVISRTNMSVLVGQINSPQGVMGLKKFYDTETFKTAYTFTVRNRGNINMAEGSIRFNRDNCTTPRIVRRWMDASTWASGYVPGATDGVTLTEKAGVLELGEDIRIRQLKMAGGSIVGHKTACPEGWSVSPDGKTTGKCYRLFQNASTYDEAELACRNGGLSSVDAHLVSVRSRRELEVVKRLCRGNTNSPSYQAGCWIGLRYSSEEGVFTWQENIRSASFNYNNTWVDWARFGGQDSDNVTVSNGLDSVEGAPCTAIVQQWQDDPLSQEQGSFIRSGCVVRRPYICQIYAKTTKYDLEIYRSALFSGTATLIGGRYTLEGEYNRVDSLLMQNAAAMTLAVTAEVTTVNTLIMEDGCTLTVGASIFSEIDLENPPEPSPFLSTVQDLSQPSSFYTLTQAPDAVGQNIRAFADPDGAALVSSSAVFVGERYSIGVQSVVQLLDGVTWEMRLINDVSSPTRSPTFSPTSFPTSIITNLPTGQPTGEPSGEPTGQPTGQPSSAPSTPTGQPTGEPTGQPSGQPSSAPSSPTGQPTGEPTGQPTGRPTSTPSVPTSTPTSSPSSPTGQPTGRPSTLASWIVPNEKMTVNARLEYLGSGLLNVSTRISAVFLGGASLATAVVNVAGETSEVVLQGYGSRMSTYDSYDLTVSHRGPVLGEYTLVNPVEDDPARVEGVYRLRISDFNDTNSEVTQCIPYNITAAELANVLNQSALVLDRGGATVRRTGDGADPAFGFGYTYRIELDSPLTENYFVNDTSGSLSMELYCYGIFGEKNCDCAETKVPLKDHTGTEKCPSFNANISRSDPHACVLEPSISILQLSVLSYTRTLGEGRLLIDGGMHRLPPVSTIVLGAQRGSGIVSASNITWKGLQAVGSGQIILAGTSWLGWDSVVDLYFAPLWEVHRRDELLHVAPPFDMSAETFLIDDFGAVLTSCPGSRLTWGTGVWGGGIIGGRSTIMITGALHAGGSLKALRYSNELVIMPNATFYWSSGNFSLANGAIIVVEGIFDISVVEVRGYFGNAALLESPDESQRALLAEDPGRQSNTYYDDNLPQKYREGWYMNPTCGDSCLNEPYIEVRGSGEVVCTNFTNVTFMTPLNLIEQTQLKMGLSNDLELFNGGNCGNDVVMNIGFGTVFTLSGGAMHMEQRCTVSGAGELLVIGGEHDLGLSIDAHITIREGTMIWPRKNDPGITIKFNGGLLIEKVGVLKIEPLSTTIVVYNDVVLRDRSQVLFPAIGIAGQPSVFDRADAPDDSPRGNLTSVDRLYWDSGLIYGKVDIFAERELYLTGGDKNIKFLAKLVNKGHAEWSSGNIVTEFNVS